MKAFLNPAPFFQWLLVPLLVALFCASLEAEARIFRSDDDKELEAVFKGATEELATLERASDGKSFTIPLERLSEEDQQWIEGWLERQQPIVPPPPVPHPLGWKRLIVTDSSGLGTFGFDGICSADSSFYANGKEIYLPQGGWVRLEGSTLTAYRQALVCYDGSSNWSLDYDDHELRLQNESDQPAKVVGVRWKENPTPQEEAKILAAIEQGASVEVDSEDLADMAAKQVKPIAAILNLRTDDVPWDRLPTSLRALKVFAVDPEFSLEGIEVLENLEYFSCHGGALLGIHSLARLPRLEALAIYGTLDLEELAALGDLTQLRHLAVKEVTQASLPTDAFDCVSKLIRLESFSMGSHFVHDKYISPSRTLQNCPNLTSFEFNTKFFGEGRFLEQLPKLSSVELLNNRIDRPFVERLMESGHFEYLRSLEIRSSLPVGDLPNLQALSMTLLPGCDFKSVGMLPQLRNLHLSFAKNEHLEQLLTHPSLREVEVLSLLASEEIDVENLEEMAQLRTLNLSDLRMESLDLSSLKNLRTLMIRDSSDLRKVILPESLQELALSSCEKIDFKEKNSTPYLRRLNVMFCDGLSSLEGFGACPELFSLALRRCRNLQTVSGLDEGPALKTCSIVDCGSIPNQFRR